MRQKIAELINIIFGFRKFILMMVLYIVGIVFRIEGLISGDNMVDLFKSTTIAFMGANGVEHLVETVKSYMDSKNQTAAPAGDNLVPDAGSEADDVKAEAGK
jgi:hypothetical protein